ncbi:MAG: hypothetical protein WDM76_09665 [Limisphaerales bacterium]
MRLTKLAVLTMVGLTLATSAYTQNVIVIDSFMDGYSFTLSDTSGTAKFNYMARATNIIGSRRQIQVRAAGSGFYGPSVIAVDISAGSLTSYGGDANDRYLQYGTAIIGGSGVATNLNLNLDIASSISIDVSSAAAGNIINLQLLFGNGNTRSTSLTVNAAGLYNVPLTNFNGITANEAADIDGIMVNPVSSAPTAPQGLILNQLSIISAIPKPALGIGTYVGQPAVYFPTATGTNFVLQMTTNLASGDWVAVTNGIPISGLVVTNPPANAFFRLQ